MRRGPVRLLVVLTAAFLLAAPMAKAAPKHRFLTELSDCGGSSLVRPQAVAVDAAGDLYVADNANGAIYVIGPDGACLTSVSGLKEPWDVAVDSTGNLYAILGSPPPYVSRGQLVRLAPSQYPPTAATSYGAPILMAEGPATAEELKSVAVDGTTDRVYVNLKARVDEYGSVGEGSSYIGSIGAGEIGVGGFGVAIDESTGDIYVSSKSNGGVYLFDGITHALLDFNDGSDRPQGPFELNAPESIDVDQQTGDLLVWDARKGILDEFNPAGEFVVQLGPSFAGNSLLNQSAIQLAVANGATSPNRGDVYLPSGYAQPPGVYVFGPLEEPRPTVATTAATAVTATSANLQGTVNPNGVELSSCQFEYTSEQTFEGQGFTGATVAPCTEGLKTIGTGTEPVPVHQFVSGLAEGDYVFRLTAGNENGTEHGTAKRFGPPTAKTTKPFPIGRGEATLRASVDPEGMPTTYFFEYGPSSEYGSATVAATLSGEEEDSVVTATVGGLAPAQTYHYRIVAENEAASVAGADEVFDTLPPAQIEECPNATFRTGFSASLPDCRAYELVTPPFMNGLRPVWISSDVSSGNFATSLADAEGENVVFETEGTIPGTDGNGVIDGHLAVRGSGGWSRSLYSPSAAQTDFPIQGGVSPDHAYSFWDLEGENGSLDRVGKTFLRGPSGFEPVGQGASEVDPEAVGRRITAGGTHVIFTSSAELPPESPPAGVEAIYDRPAGGAPHVVSLLPDGTPASAGLVFTGASEDGSAVAFEAEAAGVNHLFVRRAGETLDVATGATRFAGLASDGSSMFYEQGEALFAVDLGTQASDELAAGPQTRFVNVAASGARAFFSSGAVLTGLEENEAGEEAVAGEPNLYVWDRSSGQVSFIALLDPLDLTEFGGLHEVNLGKWVAAVSATANGVESGPAQDPSRATPDGDVLVFQSHAALAGAETGGHSQVFRYTADGGLTCVSCNPTGVPATADAVLEVTTSSDVKSPLSSLTLLPNVSEDGSTVFFMTPESLQPEDVNGVQDVYEWNEGTLSLISSGSGSANSYLYAMSADGRDVFFTTMQSLLAADEAEEGASIYDARVGGGFAEPVQPSPCIGEACQPAPPSAPGVPDPATEATGEARARHHCLRGRRRVKPPHRRRCVRRHHHKKHHRPSGHPGRRGPR